MYYLFLNGIAALRSFVLLAAYGHLMSSMAHWYLTFEMCLSSAILVQYYTTVLPAETRALHREKFAQLCTQTRGMAIRVKDESVRIVATYLPATAEYLKTAWRRTCQLAKAAAEKVETNVKQMKQSPSAIKVRSAFLKTCEEASGRAESVRRCHLVVRIRQAANDGAVKSRQVLVSVWQGLVRLMEGLKGKLAQIKSPKSPKTPKAELEAEIVPENAEVVQEFQVCSLACSEGAEPERNDVDDNADVLDVVEVQLPLELAGEQNETEAVRTEDIEVEASPVPDELETVWREPEVSVDEDETIVLVTLDAETAAVRESEAEAFLDHPAEEDRLLGTQDAVASDVAPTEDAESQSSASQTGAAPTSSTEEVAEGEENIPALLDATADRSDLAAAENLKPSSQEEIISTSDSNITSKTSLGRQTSNGGPKKSKFLHFNSKIEL